MFPCCQHTVFLLGLYVAGTERDWLQRDTSVLMQHRLQSTVYEFQTHAQLTLWCHESFSFISSRVNYITHPVLRISITYNIIIVSFVPHVLMH
jgi:hypothetical protein